MTASPQRRICPVMGAIDYIRDEFPAGPAADRALLKWSTSPPARSAKRRKTNGAGEKVGDRGRARDDPETRASPHDHRPHPAYQSEESSMPALPRRRRNPAVSTPSGAVSDAQFMPKRPSQLSLHARRRGAELAVAVEARGGPAIAAVALLVAAVVVVLLLRWLS